MKLALLIVLALCTGCVDTHPVESTDAHEVVAQLRYSRDFRTNLCFAMVSSTSYGGSRVVSIANVPCAAVPDSMLTWSVR